VLPGDGVRPGPGSTGTSSRRSVSRRVTLLAAAGIALAVAIGVTVAVAGPDDGAHSVTVRTPDGDLVAQVPLDGNTFSVGYRNSIYRTLAEERYRVLPDGRFELVQLAAEQVAVLEEYYAVPDPPRKAPLGDRLDYVVAPDPSRPAIFDELNIAATDLGERTLYVPGSRPVPIWQLVVTEDPTVILDTEENR
jgi:hypothetical protein